MVNVVVAPAAPDVIAPDGSLIGLLVAGQGASMVSCTLPRDCVTRPVAHRTVEELWYVTAGSGRLWHGGELVELRRGVSVRIETGVPFQFRSGHGGLEVLIATVPPWPGGDEAVGAEGVWEPSAS